MLDSTRWRHSDEASVARAEGAREESRDMRSEEEPGQPVLGGWCFIPCVQGSGVTSLGI